jgi:hypothetical protein
MSTKLTYSALAPAAGEGPEILHWGGTPPSSADKELGLDRLFAVAMVNFCEDKK